jgi:succinoglycan biosynthesis protein ExoM
MTLSVCIATYRRADRLAALLDDLVAQERCPDQVVVIDNDADGSAAPVVQARLAAGAPFPIRYDVQPLKNISITRNHTVAAAVGEWLAFIDDDERAPPAWLARLCQAALEFKADGVLGPVEPGVPADAPEWIRRGRFYDWARMPTGKTVPPNKLRFGNVLLRGTLLRNATPPFDPAYGLTGGEDGDLLTRLVQQGARIVWCDEATVREPVEAARLSLRWLMLRAMRGGQDFARHRLNGRFGPLGATGRGSLFLRSLLQALLAAGLTLLSWPAGRHRAAHWLMKLAANLGKMSIFAGWHYREYGGKAP